MKTLSILVATFTLAGSACAADEGTHLAGHENKIAGPPGYTTVRDNDKAMERAVKHALGPFGFFLAALRAKKPGDRSFEIICNEKQDLLHAPGEARPDLPAYRRPQI